MRFFDFYILTWEWNAIVEWSNHWWFWREKELLTVATRIIKKINIPKKKKKKKKAISRVFVFPFKIPQIFIFLNKKLQKELLEISNIQGDFLFLMMEIFSNYIIFSGQFSFLLKKLIFYDYLVHLNLYIYFFYFSWIF